MVVLFNDGRGVFIGEEEKEGEADESFCQEQRREKKGKMCRLRARPRERWAGKFIYWPRRLIVSMVFTIP